jgi:Sap, sulfolipid-1-addressing protein
LLALTLLVVSIAIADSLNPSTVVPALWLAGAPRGRGLVSFTLGVFAVYLAGGIVLVFGPGPALINAFHHVGGTVEHGLQAAGGVIAFAFAVALWRSRGGTGADRQRRHCNTHLSAFAFGAGIMAVELPTAFMYFGAISAILVAHAAAPLQVSLLVVYNALFVAPLLAILAIRLLSWDRADRWLAGGERWLRGAGQIALAAVAATAGVALVAIGVSGLVAV